MQKESLENLGEFGLIERIKNRTSLYHSTTLKGIDDDAAVISTSSKSSLVISTDSMNENIHFDLHYTPLKHLGYKSISTAISDISAMNAIPSHVLISIAISNKFTLNAIDELYEGINAAAKNYKIDVCGGDVTSSASGIFINVTAFGFVENEKITYRNGANENDIVCLTGDVGAAYLGLQLLEREKHVFLSNPEMQPDLSNFEYLLKRQLKPEARTEIIHDLIDLQVIPTAMIDVSDGLANDLLHICNQSKLGCCLYEEKIPVHKETYDTAIEIFKIDPITCMMHGGEDYELLFTIKQSDFEKIKNHPDISVIGYMNDIKDGRNLVTKAGNVVPITAQGWNHLSK